MKESTSYRRHRETTVTKSIEMLSGLLGPSEVDDAVTALALVIADLSGLMASVAGSIGNEKLIQALERRRG